MRFVRNLVLFPAVKNFVNLSRIDKVIAISLVYYFLGTQCIFADCTRCSVVAERPRDALYH